jgi:hypothetical protein
MIVQSLRDAGLDVIEGRGRGRTNGVADIEVRMTGTPPEADGTVDLNTVVVPELGTFYVQRSGRVWVLGVGPLAHQDQATVFVAAVDEMTEEQTSAVDVLLGVLYDEYEMDDEAVVPEPPDEDPEDTEITDEGDTQ